MTIIFGVLSFAIDVHSDSVLACLHCVPIAGRVNSHPHSRDSRSLKLEANQQGGKKIWGGKGAQKLIT